MAEYSFKCGSGLKTSKKRDIILSSKLLEPKIVSVKKNTKMGEIFSIYQSKILQKVWNMR